MLSHETARSRRGRAVFARARARKTSDGAAMFIVAVTLGLLAAMGVYGLSATAVDVRSAGHLREAAQAQSAAEHALMLTADTFTPGTTGELIKAMQAGQTGAGVDIQATKCSTANPFNTTTNAEYRAAQACLSWSVQEMERIARNVNPWTLDGTTNSTFTPQSYGLSVNKPFVRVEVTNPVDIPPPPGTGLNDRFTFTQVTVTTFVDMKNAADVATAATMAAESISQGRGRLTVGPYFRQ
jgi:Tfp pilus assembly protein PilX